MAAQRNWRFGFAGIAANSRPYIHTLLMADNWLPAFDMEEEKQKDKNVEGQLAHILDDLKAQKHEISTVAGFRPGGTSAVPPVCRADASRRLQHLIQVSSRCAGWRGL